MAKNGRTKVTTPEVEKYLKEGKRTIKDVAEKFTVTAATARKHVVTLTATGSAKQVGIKKLGEGLRGRPANLYASGELAAKA